MARSRRFRSKFSDDYLLVMVREVSLAANPQHPTAVSGPAFDRARGRAGHPDCPRAHKIAERLGAPWRKILAAVHEASRPAAIISVHASDRGRKGFTLDDVLTAMKLVANHLGQRELSLEAYVRGREEIVVRDERAWAHGGSAGLMLPTVNQIDEVLDQNKVTWKQALKRAGLGTVPTAPKGMTADEAVAAFALDTGYVPRSGHQVKTWKNATGHSVKALLSQELGDAVARFNAAREAPLPRAPSRLKFDNLTSKTLPKRRRFTRGRTPEQVMQGLVLAMQFLERGEKLSQRSIKRISSAHPDLDIPSWGSVVFAIKQTPGASWKKWHEEAVRRHAGEPPRDVLEL